MMWQVTFIQLIARTPTIQRMRELFYYIAAIAKNEGSLVAGERVKIIS